MKKLNNKGFMLIETVIVSVFVLTIFVLLLQNGIPIITEYEKRSRYDDVESIYSINILAKYIINNESLYNKIISKFNSVSYFELVSNGNNSDRILVDSNLSNLMESLNIDNDCKIILTKWDTNELKSNMVGGIAGTEDYNRGLVEYIGYVYKTAATSTAASIVNNAEYRIIISRKVDGKFYYANIDLAPKNSEYHEDYYISNNLDNDHSILLKLKFLDKQIKNYTIEVTYQGLESDKQQCEDYHKNLNNSKTNNYYCQAISTSINGQYTYKYVYNYDIPITSSYESIPLALGIKDSEDVISIPSTLDVTAFKNNILNYKYSNEQPMWAYME